MFVECGTESGIDTIVDDGKHVEKSENQSESNQLSITSDNSTKEYKKDKGEKEKFVPVDAKAFVDDLLAEYKNKSSGFIDSFKFSITEEAVKRAGNAIFRKYIIFKK